MIDLHTVYVIALVSQSTSALVLSFLAWSDRRARWLAPLAIACALHAAAIYLMPLWRDTGRWLPQALSAVVLIVMFYLIHLGLQALVCPSQPRSNSVHFAIVGLIAVVSALAPFYRLWASQIAWTAAIFLMAWTTRMLWRTKAQGLRGPLRATALLLLVILVQFVVRLPLEPLAPASPLLLFLRKTTMLLLTTMAFAFLALYVAESRRRLHEESRMDALTGLPNRRAMDEAAAGQMKFAARHGRPCALLLLDLDSFKNLNDTWGHDMGDRALLAAGGLLLRTVQPLSNCQVARMGGEEFAMLLADFSGASAYTFAARLCAAMAALRVRTGNKEISFTTSIGVSTWQIGETDWTEMLRRADVALYRAKDEGRNRVVLCTEAFRTDLGEETAPETFRASGLQHGSQAAPSLDVAATCANEGAK